METDLLTSWHVLEIFIFHGPYSQGVLEDKGGSYCFLRSHSHPRVADNQKPCRDR